MASVGILHPGQMGIVLAASAKLSGNRVYWASEGRSVVSIKRAQDAGLEDAVTLRALCQRVEILLSVCPPEFAEILAKQVLDAGFRGTYVDANAISPERVKKIALSMTAAGVDFVDGGIIGLASLEDGETWLHVSGGGAARIAECFAGGPVTVDVMEGEVGRASALKMCYAGYNKGSIALAGAVAAAAHRLGVYDALTKQWDRKGPGTKSLEGKLLRAAPKAWRWVGEMHEISDTLQSAGVPEGFHRAAAEVYERLRAMKDEDRPSFEEVIRRLTE